MANKSEGKIQIYNLCKLDQYFYQRKQPLKFIFKKQDKQSKNNYTKYISVIISTKVSTINQAPKKAQQEKSGKKKWLKRFSERKKKLPDPSIILKKTTSVSMLNVNLVKKKDLNRSLKNVSYLGKYSI